MNEPRDVQTIFNIVIESGHYNEDNLDWMCGSLKHCRHDGLISQLEVDIAVNEIEAYLDTAECAFLRTGLWQSGLPYNFADRLAIYKDWANRPKLQA